MSKKKQDQAPVSQKKIYNVRVLVKLYTEKKTKLGIKREYTIKRETEQVYVPENKENGHLEERIKRDLKLKPDQKFEIAKIELLKQIGLTNDNTEEIKTISIEEKKQEVGRKDWFNGM